MVQGAGASRFRASDHSPQSAASNTRLQGKRLVIARCLWAVLVAFTLGLLAFNLPHIPQILAQFQIPCSTSQCTTGILSPDALQTLNSLGMTPSTFAVSYFLLYALIPLVVWVGAGLILVSRRSDDWMALLVSLFLILFQVSSLLSGLVSVSGSANFSATTIQTAPTWFVLFYSFCQSLGFVALALFPNGRFVPSWMVWTTLGLVATEFINGFLPAENPLGLLNFLVLVTLFACLVIAMIYRYRRGATLLERQQIKWLAFGGALDFILNWVGPLLLTRLLPQSFAPHSLLNVLYQLVWPLTVLLIPISIAIAILRYRLWDIDTIINLTLVYGLLSGILGGLYIGLVIGLEGLVGLLTGHSAIPPVIVASTLAIAALFAPLRQRIQHLIDRRFYRRKYDAVRTLEAFSETLQSEVDLATLREHLLGVVNETMRPAHISLWLNTPEWRSVSRENEKT